MIIKTTLRLTYDNNFIETSALKDGSQAINAMNAINPFDSSGNASADQLNSFDSTGIISAVQLNPFDGTGIVYAHQATATNNPVASIDSVSADQATSVGDSVSADQATATNNPVASIDSVSADQATSVGDSVSADQATSVGDSVSADQATSVGDSVSADQATAVGDSVSADQLKNEGQQNFQDGTTSVYMHVDQTFDKVGLIKGYTRTITFPSAIFKPADPKNIKQIKVN